MYLEGEALENCPPPTIPEGYFLHTLQRGDEEKYSDLLYSAGFRKWDLADVEKARQKCLENGIFILVEKSTGRFAACAYCNRGPVPGEEGGGILGMVAVAPDLRGHHLAEVVCRAVIQKFREHSYTRLCLFTDETRLPALKTYLKLGWKPVIRSEDSLQSWQNIAGMLNWKL